MHEGENHLVDLKDAQLEHSNEFVAQLTQFLCRTLEHPTVLAFDEILGLDKFSQLALYILTNLFLVKVAFNIMA